MEWNECQIGPGDGTLWYGRHAATPLGFGTEDAHETAHTWGGFMWNIVHCGLAATGLGLVPRLRMALQGEGDGHFFHWTLQLVWDLAPYFS